MKYLKSIVGNIYFRNLLLAAAIVIAIILSVLWFLAVYTHHGEAVVVPDVKHLQVEEAAPFFAKAGLRYEVVDSIYVKNAKPGSIVEVIPSAGSKVKTDRIIFIVTNYFSAELFSLPEVKDLSQRQAEAMLRASGFEDISVRLVSAPYKDLVVGIEYMGAEALPGKKLPSAAKLVLLVSSGVYSEASETEDSDMDIQTQEEPIQDNSWF